MKKAPHFSQLVLLTELSTFLPTRKGKAFCFHHAELCQQRHPQQLEGQNAPNF